MNTVFLLTYNISPYRGSESSVSWNYVKEMSKDNRLIVLYGNYQTDIDNYLKDHPMPNVTFINLPEVYTSVGHGISEDIKFFIHYKRWHKQAYEMVKEILSKEQVDVIHYLNPIGFKDPGYLWKIDKPYIWGPITAVHNYPLPLYKSLSLYEKFHSFFFRRVLHNALFIFDPLVRKAIKRCDVIGAATPRTKEMLQSIHQKDSFYLPENGILEIERHQPVELIPGRKLELIWIGALNTGKNLILLLEVMCLRHKEFSDKVTLHIIGDGYLRWKLEKYVRDNHLDDMIVWHGHIPRDEVQQLFLKSHLHVITSLSEATTTVIWEAMSKAVPTMTLDHCGMRGVVCEKCGIKIPINSYKQVVHDMSDHLIRIIGNPQEINRLSQGVIECAQKYTWDKRREFFNRQYEAAKEIYRRKSLMA
jgi:glycosyltransferase involved in cell wall biosynthesis